MWLQWVSWVNWLECVDTGLYIQWNRLVTSSAYGWLAYSHVTDRVQTNVVNTPILCSQLCVCAMPYYYNVTPTSMASVLPPLPGQQLWLPGWASGLPHCDPGEGAFLGRGAFFGWGGLPLQHFGPQCPILSHLEHLESLVGQSLEGAGGVWPSPSWLVCTPQCLSWQIASTGLELLETCSQACWMAK